MKCGGLTPIVAMVSSEHVIMQNEALIALAVMSSTVEGTKFNSSIGYHSYRPFPVFFQFPDDRNQFLLTISIPCQADRC